MRKYFCIRAFSMIGIIGSSLLSCSDDGPTYAPPAPPPVEEAVGKAEVWVTTGNQSRLLAKGEDIDIVEGTGTDHPAITIDFTKKLQEIEGYGAALSGSSAWLINNKMSAGQRNELIKDLFDPEDGIGISYLRMTVGASDFSLSDYTYNDLPTGQTDPELEQFSIAKDREDVVPVLKMILGTAPSLKIMGSPWSAPAWMKTNGRLAGGRLKTEWYDTYANYFVKYIQAYQEEGITIDAITIQNEPLHEAAYPSMRMEADEQRDFIKSSLGPVFRSAGLSTKIIAYDHNFDRADYPIAILNDSEAKQYIAGSAFHAYGGNTSAMSQVYAAHPEKGLYFTEISGGEWATDFSDNLKWFMSNILIGTSNHWSKTALFWNLALDENSGPKNGGCQDCRGVVTITASGNYVRNEEYYAIGHFSKFVRPGASRLSGGSFPSSTQLESVAFQNTDGTKVLIVLNTAAAQKTFSVIFGDQRFNYSLEGNAVATIVWD